MNETALSAPKKVRITSLDWARGWMLVASVTVNTFVVTPEWFDHAPWQGVHPIDVIFPIFVTLSGCGLAFALGRVVKFRPLIRRFIVLMVAGLIYNAIVNWSFDVFTWRVTGVLQLYAVLVALVGLLHLVTKSWQGWAIITVLLASLHTIILSVYATNCPAGVLTRACNPSGPLDSFLFGNAHVYAQGAAGHDPEGIIVIMGAMISASAGATVGHLLKAVTTRGQKENKGPALAIKPLLITAVGFLLLAALMKYTFPIALGVDLPVMKRLWTAPFALIVAAFVTVVLLIGHLLLDRPNVPKWLSQSSYPLISLGRNSLLVYFGSHVLMSLLNRPWGGHDSIGVAVTGLMPSIIWGQIIWTAILLTFWVCLATYLHYRKIYLRP